MDTVHGQGDVQKMAASTHTAIRVKALQTGLDDVLPAPPFGEGTQGHHGFPRDGLGRAGFVEPVRVAWRRNSRLGAASWRHSP